jgi:sugar phosphate permease
MIAFGVGEVLGCFFIGFVIDKIGSKKSSWVNVGICIIMTVVTIIYVVNN